MTVYKGIPKIIIHAGNDALLEACQGVLMQYIGDDGGIKSAASDVFPRHKLAEFAPPKGKFMVHMIAMGAGDYYGPNKNGDYFSKRALLDRHHTFVTNGHMFREHRNRNPQLAIGEIKASAYHPDLNRVELVLWGDCEKAAKEFALVKAGKQLSGSMSCKVKFDVCSACKNQAKSAAYYCNCIRHRLLQFDKKAGVYIYMDNPDPEFFDYSSVENPADRLAHGLQSRIHVLEKAASGGTIITGAELAELAGVDLNQLFSPLNPDRRALLSKLAAAEAQMEQIIRERPNTREFIPNFIMGPAVSAFDPEASLDLHKAARVSPGTLFYELGKRACILPPAVFFNYIREAYPQLGDKMAAVNSRLPWLFRDLDASVKSGAEMDFCGCDPSSRLGAQMDPEYDDQIDGLMQQADDQFGVNEEPLRKRTIQITIIKTSSALPEPKITEDPEVQGMLDLYGVYKLAAVDTISEMHPELDSQLLHFLAIGQNLQLAMQ